MLKTSKAPSLERFPHHLHEGASQSPRSRFPKGPPLVPFRDHPQLAFRATRRANATPQRTCLLPSRKLLSKLTGESLPITCLISVWHHELHLGCCPRTRHT
ncbi:hypothetical protein CR513_26627, partial [Mucuna pruriens]